MFRAKHVVGLGCFVCLSALAALAAPESSRIAGIVVDPSGTPQMGATVVVTAEQLANLAPEQVLTNATGRFSTATLPAGLYSIKVTLAGFLPAAEQHIRVDAVHATLLQVVLGSVFTSFSNLRRDSSQPASNGLDDWSWVLRSSPSTRSVLRWQEDPSLAMNRAREGSSADAPRARVELSSGAVHPGSISNSADSPATAVAYDVDLGATGHMLVAGQLSHAGDSGSGALVGEWLPAGLTGTGPVTTFLVRESRLGPAGPTFRGLRMSHDGQIALTGRVSVRYGGEYVMAGLNGTTSALRPRGEVAVQISPTWEADIMAATRPWQDSPTSADELQSALNAFDALPTLMLRRGRPVFENDAHEEGSVRHTFSHNADLTGAVFHDRSTQTAVMGRRGPEAPDFLQDYFSAAFAYDGGASESMGARVAYRQRVNEHLNMTVVYSYAGALAPDGQTSEHLRDELSTQYRHSVAGQVTTTVPGIHTKLTSSYKWLNGNAVSRQDPYGEAEYHLDPYLSMQIRQPLPSVIPGHVEIEAAVGNLLAQGYVRVATHDGSVLLVPSYRYFRGGLSLQF